MRTQINYQALKDNEFNQSHLELLHMIAFEYNMDELQLESKLSLEELHDMLNELYIKLDVTSTAGLIRAAFEKKLLQLW